MGRTIGDRGCIRQYRRCRVVRKAVVARQTRKSPFNLSCRVRCARDWLARSIHPRSSAIAGGISTQIGSGAAAARLCPVHCSHMTPTVIVAMTAAAVAVHQMNLPEHETAPQCY
jgi:hypothetical protein